MLLRSGAPLTPPHHRRCRFYLAVLVHSVFVLMESDPKTTAPLNTRYHLYFIKRNSFIFTFMHPHTSQPSGFHGHTALQSSFSGIVPISSFFFHVYRTV